MKTKFFSKQNLRGLWGTLLFHSILLAIFLLVGFKTPYPPPPKEEVMEVELGGGGGGGGSDQTMPEVSKNTPLSDENVDENITTNEVSETATPITNKTVKVKKVEKTVAVVNPLALYKKNNKNNGTGGGQGTGTGTGTGSGTGPGSGSGSGGGTGSGIGTGTGPGTGPSFSLNGRSAKYLHKPDNNFSEQGTVVVNIWVNQNGEVTRAEAGARGTNSTNTQLWKLATSSALKTKFSTKNDAPEEQKGTITYHFIRMN
ncbi:MAG: energy transducer TonB [Bacteroidota bacterium]